MMIQTQVSRNLSYGRALHFESDLLRSRVGVWLQALPRREGSIEGCFSPETHLLYLGFHWSKEIPTSNSRISVA